MPVLVHPALAQATHLAMHGQVAWLCLATRAWGSIKGSLATWRQRFMRGDCPPALLLRSTNGTFHCSNERISTADGGTCPIHRRKNILRWRPGPWLHLFACPVPARRRASRRFRRSSVSTDACAIGKGPSTTGRRVEMGPTRPPVAVELRRQWMFEQALFGGQTSRHGACPNGLLSTQHVTLCAPARAVATVLWPSWGAGRCRNRNLQQGCRSVPARAAAGDPGPRL